MSAHSGDPSDPFPARADHWTAGADRPPSSARARALASARTVHCDDGQWRVYEIESGPYDRRSGRSLIFESDGVLRRVRSYPTEWRELSDTELMEVSWRR
ncbi:MAG TPA: hypothetical protein VL524_08655 [Gemmatimonadaceae bacterium]|jgi:hypothetical protein|nr:hypothetical protein [Gemmatimonadaceae bacterium]